MTRLSRGSLARARRGFAAAASIAAVLMVWAFPGNAQTYPNKPIRMIVSIAAGSVTDVIMRAAAAELQPRLGQPVVIENIGGAAGILGGKTCAQAPADGYTLCIIYHSTMSFNPLLFTNLPYNADRPRAGGAAVLPGRGAVRVVELNVSTAELKASRRASPRRSTTPRSAKAPIPTCS